MSLNWQNEIVCQLLDDGHKYYYIFKNQTYSCYPWIHTQSTFDHYILVHFNLSLLTKDSEMFILIIKIYSIIHKIKKSFLNESIIKAFQFSIPNDKKETALTVYLT